MPESEYTPGCGCACGTSRQEPTQSTDQTLTGVVNVLQTIATVLEEEVGSGNGAAIVRQAIVTYLPVGASA